MREFSAMAKSTLLDVVQRYYNGDISVPHIEDIREVMDFAVVHELSPILMYMLLGDKENVDIDKNALKVQYLKRIQANLTITRESEKLSHYLEEQGVPHSFIKGQYTKDFYIPHEVRTMGDADMYIPAEYTDKAKEYFDANGYHVDNYYEGVTTFKKNFVEFEVHSVIEWFGIDWAERFPLEENGVFSARTQLIFTIIHALKHIVGYGCGIRQVLDTALLLRNDSSVLGDKDFIGAIHEIRVDKCYNALIGVINRWFGTSYPCVEDIDATNVLEITILDGGVFGKNLNDYETVNVVQHKSKMKMIWRMLFPKYERMVLSYPKLEKHKCLLPYYYVVRLLTHGIKEKRYKIVSEKGRNEHAIDNRRKFMEILDLEEQHYNKI